MNQKEMIMKVILNLFVQIILVFALLLSLGCSSKSETSKEVAEEQNDEKFETKQGEQDSKFLVEAVDNSYTILNLAKLGKEKGNKETISKAEEVIEGQTKVLNKLKEYAAAEVVSVPASGPEVIKDTQKDLYDEQEKFNEKWCKEIVNENEKMLRDFEAYADKSEGNLKVVIAEALPTLRAHQDKLQAYNKDVNK
jgi:putative membrane protein